MPTGVTAERFKVRRTPDVEGEDRPTGELLGIKMTIAVQQHIVTGNVSSTNAY